MCPFLIIANLLETLWSESTVFSFYSFSFMVPCPLICLVTFASCMLYFKIIFRNNLRPRMLSSSKKLSVCFSPGTGGTRGPGYYLNTHNKPWNILSWATKGLDMDLCPCEDKLTSRLSLFCGPNEKVRAVQNQTESPILEVPRFWLFSLCLLDLSELSHPSDRQTLPGQKRSSVPGLHLRISVFSQTLA